MSWRDLTSWGWWVLRWSRGANVLNMWQFFQAQAQQVEPNGKSRKYKMGQFNAIPSFSWAHQELRSRLGSVRKMGHEEVTKYSYVLLKSKTMSLCSTSAPIMSGNFPLLRHTQNMKNTKNPAEKSCLNWRTIDRLIDHELWKSWKPDLSPKIF